MLELSRVLAGLCTALLLADLGADVVKVEHVDGGRNATLGPPSLDETAAYLVANRNKRSVVANLANEYDNATVRRLDSVADVVVETFRPGSLRNFGLDADATREVNARVVYRTTPGFGSQSPIAIGLDSTSSSSRWAA